MDNCANVNIWNDSNAFIPESYLKINAEASTAVSAVNGEGNLPADCGNVPISWKDDKGQTYNIVLKNVLHFPKSPVKILSVVSLAEQLKDDLDTWILSRRYQSIFTWDFGKFTKTILHGNSKLPELQVQSSLKNAEAFYSLVRKSNSADCHLIFNKAFKTDRSSMAREENSAKTDLLFACTTKQAYEMDSADDVLDDSEVFNSNPPIPTLFIGCSVRYLQDDHVETGTLIGVDISDPSKPALYDIEFKDNRKVQTTREHLELLETPDAFAIPTQARQILEVAYTISKEVLDKLRSADVLTPLQQLWLWWHEVLDHLPRIGMNWLVEKGSLPSKFKALKDWKFVCPSCLLAIQRKRSWRSKAEPSSIGKNIEINGPGDFVCTDHIISAQPGLLPRISGNYTRDRITSACIFKDAYSSFTYVHLQTSFDLEQTINAKIVFEKLAETYGVKVKHYHADNGHYACQGFRNAISEAGQTISFCGVGAHHQNGVAENMIGLLTRWARTSLLHAKKRWSQAISTILWPYALKAACSRYNELHLDKNGVSPECKFASTDTAPV